MPTRASGSQARQANLPGLPRFASSSRALPEHHLGPAGVEPARPDRLLRTPHRQHSDTTAGMARSRPPVIPGIHPVGSRRSSYVVASTNSATVPVGTAGVEPARSVDRLLWIRRMVCQTTRPRFRAPNRPRPRVKPAIDASGMRGAIMIGLRALPLNHRPRGQRAEVLYSKSPVASSRKEGCLPTTVPHRGSPQTHRLM